MSAEASAFERQWHLGGGLGYAGLGGDNGSPGIGVGGHLAYGLSDSFNALLHLDLSSHPNNSRAVYSTSGGIAYVLDVLQWVPYVGVTGGGYWVVGRSEQFSFGASAVLGLDYQFRRDMAVGLCGRYHALLGGDFSSYMTAFLRLEYLFGY